MTLTGHKIWRVSETYPAPTLDSHGRPTQPWLPTSVVREEWGRLQIVVGGVDVTYLRGVPSRVASWDLGEPYGPLSAVLEFPQVTSFESPSSLGLGAGKNVEIYHVLADGSRSANALWEGVTVDPQDITDGTILTIDCLGVIRHAGLSVLTPRFDLDELDVGTVIPDTLNGTRSKRFSTIAHVTTGILTRKRGALSQTRLDFASELLASATTSNGSGQWTIGWEPGRAASLRLKSTSTISYTVTVGARGVSVNLTADASTTPNVIYGEGVADDGCTWRNSKYPNLHPDDSTPYPFTSPSSLIGLSYVTTDAGTDSGTGVSDWQRRAKSLGYAITVDGTYSSADEQVCKDLQADMGITVDGIVGPQTWAATFNVGANAGDLRGAYIAPLAYASAVEPRLYNADGADNGPNPAYDPTILRVERYINFGSGISKATGVKAAKDILARNPNPGTLGTVVLDADPQECHRFEIREGRNLKLKGYRGADVTLHIAGVSVDPNSGTVTLTVDSRNRDLLTISEILARNKEAKTNPAFALHTTHKSAQSQDMTVAWDCENGAGIIPHHAQYGGLWTVLRIPTGQVGQIAKVTASSSSPACAFAIGLFGKEITAANLVSIVGNPLASTDPWAPHASALDAFGWIEAWGSSGQAGGYYPGQQANNDPVTGNFEDNAGLYYSVDIPPWMYVAIYTAQACFLEGRLEQSVFDG